MIIAEIIFCCVLNLYGFKSFVVDSLFISLYLGEKYLVLKFPVWNTEGTLTVVIVHACSM